MAGNEEKDPASGTDRAVEGGVDRLPGLVERMTVKVENAVRRDGAGAKPPVPMRI
jgi:hypothetical protein